MKQGKIIIWGGILVALLGAFVFRGTIRSAIVTLSRPSVPIEQPRPTETALGSTPLLTATPFVLPDEFNLAVPFTSQAPHMVWDHDHDDFCEEASSLMAAAYLTGDFSITDADIAEVRLQAIKTWQVEHLGYFEDTNVTETLRILREYLGVAQAHLEFNPNTQDMKEYLAQGKVMLVPVAGQLLGNPHFRQPGPPYHMILLKGYTDDGNFIANDPGTRYGANYVYPEAVIMNAMHDYNGGDVRNGAKVIIVVG